MFNGSQNLEVQDVIITNDDFWPDLNVGDFEKRRGVPAHMNKDSITYAVAAAMAQVNLVLEQKKKWLIQLGCKCANDAKGLSVNNKNVLVILYEKAVYARAKADLLPEYATQQATAAANQVAERETTTKNQLLAESQQHIRTILGRSRVGVELL